MDKFKNIRKDGWHPGGKPASRDTFRAGGIAQVKGWIGKGTSSSSSEPEHVTRPLTSLKDPSAFGPPPKNLNYYPDGSTNHASSSHTTGFGAPIPETSAAKYAQPARQAQAEERPVPPPPPAPYRVDTTGLQTTNLPPPPRRRTNVAGSAEQSPSRGSAAAGPLAAHASTPKGSKPTPTAKPKPALPPRLPPRESVAQSPAATSASPQSPSPPPYGQNAASLARAQAPAPKAPPPPTTPPAADAPFINQSALSRLTNAGVRVPGLGIGPGSGSGASVGSTEAAGASTSGPGMHSPGTVGELQERFGRMGTELAGKKAPPPVPRAKKAGLGLGLGGEAVRASGEGAGGPPPVPLGTKPR